MIALFLTTPWGILSFVHPWILASLLLIPLVSWLRGFLGGTPGVLFSSTQLLLEIGRARSASPGAFLISLSYGALGFIVIALARPQLGQTQTHITASGIDIMLVLDVSGSMAVEDYSIGGEAVSRLQAVKQVTEQFIEGRPNDRIGIVAFARYPYLVSPITLDHEWLIQNLDRVQLGLVADGTAIGSALATAAARLKNRDAKSRIIVLLTDGANNAGKIMPLTAAEATKALGIKIYTIGAGSNGPVKIPTKDPFGRTFYQQVQFDFDEKLLASLASLGDGQYFRAADAASLRKTFHEIDRLEKSTIEMEKNVQHHDLFWGLLILASLLLLLEVILSQTRYRKIP